jgi:Calcineurin-like phosphoesterase
LIGAGDISSCTQENDSITAALIDGVIAGVAGEVVVFTAGDNVYDYGSAEEFAQCFDPAWGRHRQRTRPAPGNHDYATAGAGGYFGYFGTAAGEPGLGYYSYDLGSWHIIVLNTSNHCRGILCSHGSAQEQWLRADLATHPAVCTLAIWHDPLFSSGVLHGGAPSVQPFWNALYEYGAEIVINGHEHNYERFAPQTPDGAADPNTGIRQFIAGTGGEGHYRAGDSRLPNSEAANDDTYGVLKLTLHASSYDWEFVPEPRGTFRDSGITGCHGPP